MIFYKLNLYEYVYQHKLRGQNKLELLYVFSFIVTLNMVLYIDF